MTISSTPIRVQFKTACELLDISRETLRHIVRTDNTFPRPIKTRDAKQAPVYFDYAELLEWHKNQMKSLFQSKKHEALKLQNWIFTEVLPAIRQKGSYSARQTAFEELNQLCMQELVSKDKGTFHSHGMHRRKREKHMNALSIQICKANLQLTFEGFYHD